MQNRTQWAVSDVTCGNLVALRGNRGRCAQSAVLRCRAFSACCCCNPCSSSIFRARFVAHPLLVLLPIVQDGKVGALGCRHKWGCHMRC